MGISAWQVQERVQTIVKRNNKEEMWAKCLSYILTANWKEYICYKRREYNKAAAHGREQKPKKRKVRIANADCSFPKIGDEVVGMPFSICGKLTK